MEVAVLASGTSDGKISTKKSSNGENKDVVAHFSAEERCNEERKGSGSNDRSNCNLSEFSLERKMSFKELRKRAEEIKDEPNLTPKGVQVSLVMECKDKLQHVQQKEMPTNKREERNHSEGSVNGEPVSSLHLSQIKIQQWTKIKATQDVEEALIRVKQVCGALEGDAIYHYENVDDFDDTINTRHYQPNRCRHSRRSRLLGAIKLHICCKYKYDENGMISADVTCGGNPTENYEVDPRLYLLKEIARGAKTIQCLQKGCTNFYDPSDVVEVVGNEGAQAWLENFANDPLNGRHENTILPLITQKENFQVKKTSLIKKARKSEPKENWWTRKSKTKKIKVFELPKTTPDGKPVTDGLAISAGKGDKDATSKVIKYKHECATCLEGFNEDPEPGGLTCKHYTCRLCLEHYFKVQMRNMITSIECPRLDCCERFDTSFILAVLDNIPLRNAYIRLYNKRKELNYRKKSYKSDETCHQRMEQAAESSSEENQERITNLEVSKTSSDHCIKLRVDCKRCPGCDSMTHRTEDDEACNIVICGFCRTKFCWNCGKKCNEAFHLYKCPLYGRKKFSKRRKIANLFGYSTGLAVAVPVVGSLVIGTGAVALATLIAIGSLSPPVLLSRKMHKYYKLHSSSACRKRLSVLGGVSLGVLALPVLSSWGVYKTVLTASRKAAKIIYKLRVPEEDDGDINLKPKVAADTFEINGGQEKESTMDKNTVL